MVSESDLHRSQVRVLYDPGQVVHTHVPPFTDQYKLVPTLAGS